jgi:NAD(P)-dependent dehydrogenase (short-subunit alcohol dehydrogenase family)
MDTQTPVALITGASKGLGLEIARVFARRGMPLIITARGEGALGDAAEELRVQTEVLAMLGDVADPIHVAQLVEMGMRRFGHIDVLVNNASTLGPLPMPALEDYPLGDFLNVMAVNAGGPLHLAQRVLPQMRERGSGVVINVTSDAGTEAYEGWGGYGASKAALDQLSLVLAVELKGSGVRLYLVDPGEMDTEMHRDAEPGVDLSHLPGPATVAPFFLRLIDEETAPFGRYMAQGRHAALEGSFR